MAESSSFNDQMRLILTLCLTYSLVRKAVDEGLIVDEGDISAVTQIAFKQVLSFVDEVIEECS